MNTKNTKPKILFKVICPYCNSQAKLVDSALIYGKSYGKIYLCQNWPKCNSYVGVHKNTDKPLGTMTNAELRTLRQKAHAVFDPIWIKGVMNRGQAYKLLSEALKIDISKTHIGMFDVEQCKKAIELMKTFNF